MMCSFWVAIRLQKFFNAKISQWMVRCIHVTQEKTNRLESGVPQNLQGHQFVLRSWFKKLQGLLMACKVEFVTTLVHLHTISM